MQAIPDWSHFEMSLRRVEHVFLIESPPPLCLLGGIIVDVSHVIMVVSSFVDPYRPKPFLPQIPPALRPNSYRGGGIVGEWRMVGTCLLWSFLSFPYPF